MTPFFVAKTLPTVSDLIEESIDDMIDNNKNNNNDNNDDDNDDIIMIAFLGIERNKSGQGQFGYSYT